MPRSLSGSRCVHESAATARSQHARSYVCIRRGAGRVSAVQCFVAGGKEIVCMPVWSLSLIRAKLFIAPGMLLTLPEWQPMPALTNLQHGQGCNLLLLMLLSVVVGGFDGCFLLPVYHWAAFSQRALIFQIALPDTALLLAEMPYYHILSII